MLPFVLMRLSSVISTSCALWFRLVSRNTVPISGIYPEEMCLCQGVNVTDIWKLCSMKLPVLISSAVKQEFVL